MLNKIATFTLIILFSVGITVTTSKYKIAGNDIGGTKSLLTYSHNENNEIHYPSPYLQLATIVRAENNFCTAVNSLPTEARGWPLYFSIDDSNCKSTKIFPVIFILDTFLYACVIYLILIIVRRLIKV